jgi:uncharacterized protein with PQ loop repeat
MYKYIFGWLATSCTLSYKFPQIYFFYKKKTSNGISILSLYIQTLAYILYGIHGIIINDYPILVMGCISFFLNVILCIQYHYYKNNNFIIE